MVKRDWVTARWEQWLLPHLQQAQTEQDVIDIAQEEMAFWRTRAKSEYTLKTPQGQQRGYIKDEPSLSAEVRAWAWEHLTIGKEKHQELNAQTAARLETKLEHQVLLKDPEKIVDQAVAALDASRWESVAAGLCLLTGRRPTEILLSANFMPHTPYTVMFAGQIKHPLEKAYEIPVLCEASKVLAAAAKLRSLLVIPDGVTTTKVNNTWGKPLSEGARWIFGELIPPMEIPNEEGEVEVEQISAKTLRVVYQRLAVRYFCPEMADPDSYASEIAGHRRKDDPEERSQGAAPYYRTYKIVDENGRTDGRQALWLGKPGVVVLKEFSGSHDPSLIGPVPASKPALLTPEVLFAGAELEEVLAGMEAAGYADFVAYMKGAALLRARRDLGIARHNTIEDVSKLSMNDLVKMRKSSAAHERIRRGIEAIAAYNDTHEPLERWFISPTFVYKLIGGRYQTVVGYIEEHAEEVNSLNKKYDLSLKFNRKPYEIGTVISVE